MIVSWFVKKCLTPFEKHISGKIVEYSSQNAFGLINL